MPVPFTISARVEPGEIEIGTHEGELFGIPGSGKPIAWRQCHLITVAHGRATAHRAIRDDLGLMRQMGAIPGG